MKTTGIWCTVLLALLCLHTGAVAQESMSMGGALGDTRKQTMENMRDLDGPYLIDRIEAIKKLANLSDPALAKEFKVTEKLSSAVTNTRKFSTERIEALRALIKLHQNSIPTSDLLTMLTDIIQARKAADKHPSAIPLREQALGLVEEVALGSDNFTERDKLFLILSNLWQQSLKGRPEPIPMVLRTATVRAISAFTDKREAIAIILEGMDRRMPPEVRTASLEALRHYLDNSTNATKDLTQDIEREFQRSMTEGDPESRTLLLQCLEQLIANYNLEIDEPRDRYSPQNKTKEAALDLLAKGTDMEAMAAARFTMRLSRDEYEIVDPLLAVAVPNPRKPRSIEAMYDFNKALVEVMLNLKEDAKKGRKPGEKIIDHFNKLLDPRSKLPKLPDMIRRTALIGLSAIPIEFDRRDTMKLLINLLNKELTADAPNTNFMNEVQEALEMLSGQSAFVDVEWKEVEGQAPKKIETPSAKKWAEWFQKNEDGFKPGNAPYE